MTNQVYALLVWNTVVWALASICVFQNPTPGELAWAQKLGKDRSQFGDLPNSGLWKHGYTGQFGGTYILFRAGSATERYYVTTSPGAKRWRISRETRVKGTIRKDWIIFVEDGTEPRIKKPGPLWLHGGNGKVVGKIPKKALADLQNQVALALYHSNMNASYCQFIYSDGKESKYTNWEPQIIRHLAGGVTSEDYSKLPITVDPYPISPEEQAYVSRKHSSGN